ncbi:hypothetical protein BDU57DRAFT_579069 [Ampelomyces quisqualis]|uniref:Uncharacterized protein n=1 Tax=Ampelomyces quisqualis TaxID=50730 RepID=A0A6A5QH23_AMPQU|nr:hypothetical protein BDU57DRAFT_579069 [Ampelomyces quisqualis]
MLPITFHRKMDTSRLHGSELRSLASILQGVPAPGYAALDDYNATVDREVKALPRRMRQSVLFSKSALCMTHKGLDHNLIDDVWDWVKYEFDSGIGKQIFPLILSRKLTAAQERKIRQLEPVLQMWRKEFRIETSAPPGRAPIDAGSKWSYQKDRCKGCMLARIGSDEGIVFALFAGMITRFPAWKLVSGRPDTAELTVAKLAHLKSKRVRFVRYWLRAFDKNNVVVTEATEFGLTMKKLYREWKDNRKADRPSIYGGRYSEDSTLQDSRTDPFSDRHRVSTEASERSRSTTGPASRHLSTRTPSSRQPPSPHSSTSHRATDTIQRTQTDPKLGPQPRSNSIHPHTPLEEVGFKHPSYRVRPPPSVPDDIFSDLASTIYPDDSISCAPTRIHQTSPTRWHNPIFENLDLPPSPPLHPRPLTIPRQLPNPSRLSTSSARTPASRSSSARSPPSLTTATSLASTATIQSYDGGRSSAIPIPSRHSMYFGYGEVKADPFEQADEYAEEVQTTGAAGGKWEAGAGTEWSKLY